MYELSNATTALNKVLSNTKECIRIVSALLLCLVVICVSFFTQMTHLDFLLLLLLLLMLMFAFSVDTVERKHIYNKIEKFLLSLYLNHNIFRIIIIPYFFKTISIKSIVVYIVSVSFYSWCTSIFIDKLMNGIKDGFRKHMKKKEI